MSKDPTERRTYRRSPGRHYDEEHDPLRGQTRSGRPGASVPGRDTSQAGGLSTSLAPRPNLRRTRQLMRQNILASKSKAALYEDMQQETEDQDLYENQGDRTLYSARYLARGNRPAQGHTAAPQTASQRFSAPEEEDLQGEWLNEEEGFVDPDLGEVVEYEDQDPLEQRLGSQRRSPAPYSTSRRLPDGRQSGPPLERAVHRRTSVVPGEEEYYIEEEEEQPPERRKKKKRGISRRALLWGAGAVAIGGTAVAAYELAPKLPGAIQDVGSNIEHQLEDAFKKGFSEGANSVRKEFINALDNLEGVSLDTAISTAKFTRIAYDVFVSPLVTLAAKVTGDFLATTLRAFKTGRYWLSTINQDNETLGALQTVLETWLQQVTQMPKQIQSITDADLEGAQAYLAAVKRKIKQEQDTLNGTPTPSAQPKSPTPTPTPHS
jgi:hypothetical protein